MAVLPHEAYTRDASAALAALAADPAVTILGCRNCWGVEKRAASWHVAPRWSYGAGLYIRAYMAGGGDGVLGTDDTNVEFSVALHTAESDVAALAERALHHRGGTSGMGRPLRKPKVLPKAVARGGAAAVPLLGSPEGAASLGLKIESSGRIFGFAMSWSEC